MSTPTPAAQAAAQAGAAVQFQKLLPYLNLAVQKNASDIFTICRCCSSTCAKPRLRPVWGRE